MFDEVEKKGSNKRKSYKSFYNVYALRVSVAFFLSMYINPVKREFM